MTIGADVTSSEADHVTEEADHVTVGRDFTGQYDRFQHTEPGKNRLDVTVWFSQAQFSEFKLASDSRLLG